MAPRPMDPAAGGRGDTRLPPGLVSSADPAEEAERSAEVAAALDRVRIQLGRTQRTLDAFVAQITGIPVGTAAAPDAAAVMATAVARSTEAAAAEAAAASPTAQSADLRARTAGEAARRSSDPGGPAPTGGRPPSPARPAPPGVLAEHVHGRPPPPRA